MRYTIKIDKEKEELYVERNGQVVETMPCSTGVGRPFNGFKGITEPGRYLVEDISVGRYMARSLRKNHPEIKGNPYGPYVAGLIRENGEEVSIGIHGTNNPEGLGKPVSAGCVRIANHNIRRLVEQRVITKGTLVEIIGESENGR